MYIPLFSHPHLKFGLSDGSFAVVGVISLPVSAVTTASASLPVAASKFELQQRTGVIHFHFKSSCVDKLEFESWNFDFFKYVIRSCFLRK